MEPVIREGAPPLSGARARAWPVRGWYLWYLACELCLLVVGPMLPPLGRAIVWLLAGRSEEHTSELQSP